MTVDVTSVFATYLAQNRGPDPKDPTGTRPSEYGVSAEWEDGVVRLVLTFLAGCVYCCMESGCHLSLFSTKRWEWLRRELSARGIQLPSRLTLMVEIVVEEGAIFFDYSGRTRRAGVVMRSPPWTPSSINTLSRRPRCKPQLHRAPELQSHEAV